MISVGPGQTRRRAGVFLDTRVDAEGAFVGTDNDMPAVNQNATERRQACEASMLERGAQPVVIDVPSLDSDFERLAFEEATRLFKAGVPIGGTILCANDRVAFGVMAAACQPGYPLAGLRSCALQGTTITR